MASVRSGAGRSLLFPPSPAAVQAPLRRCGLAGTPGGGAQGACAGAMGCRDPAAPANPDGAPGMRQFPDPRRRLHLPPPPAASLSPPSACACAAGPRLRASGVRARASGTAPETLAQMPSRRTWSAAARARDARGLRAASSQRFYFDARAAAHVLQHDATAGRTERRSTRPMIRAGRLFLVPALSVLLLLIPVVGAPLMLIAIGVWYIRNQKKIHLFFSGRLYQQEEYSDDVLDSSR